MGHSGSFLSHLFGGKKEKKDTKSSVVTVDQKAAESQVYVQIYRMAPVVGKRNCPMCDSENPPTAQFCSICGERI